MEWTDQEAAERARQGDQGAFRVLVERHSHAIFKLAFRMSANEQDAEDLVQETFLRAYKQLQRFDGRCAIGTWLYRICVNCSLDLIRARRQRRERQPPDVGDDGMQHWLERVATCEPSPERLSHSRQIATLLEPAMNRLSETERSAFILRHYEGCGIEQIAEVLGVQQGAAKHSIFPGRAKAAPCVAACVGSRNQMTHPNEEQLVNSYYEGLTWELKLHLESCSECASLYQNICETLNSATENNAPERGADYGAQVWARVRPHLASQETKGRRFPRWQLVPAMAALTAVVFIAGMFTERKRTASLIAKPESVVATAKPEQSPAVIQPPQKTFRKPSPAQHRQTARQHQPAQVRVKQTEADIGTPSDSDQDQKLLALNSRLSGNDATAMPELLEMINGGTSDKTKEHALFVLAQDDSPEARNALLHFARQSSNPLLQTRALRMMSMTGGEGARKELTTLYTSSSDQELKRKILNELMVTGSKSTLLAVARNESDPGLRNSAITNLSITGAQAELSQLYRSAAPNDEKKQILNSVFLTGDPNMLLAILKQEKDPALRVAAINSLAAMNGRGAVLINVYRTDSSDAVRQAVLDALAVQHNNSALFELAREETDLRKKAEILRRIDALGLPPLGKQPRP